MADRAEIDSKNQPERFMMAIERVQALLADHPELAEAYFDSDRSINLPGAAQMFDFVTGGSPAIHEASRPILTHRSATRLREALDSYDGPEAVKAIYTEVYGEPLSEILGEGE